MTTTTTTTSDDDIDDDIDDIEIDSPEHMQLFFGISGEYGRPMSSSLLLAGGGGYLASNSRDADVISAPSSSSAALKHPHRNSDPDPSVSLEKGGVNHTSRRQKLTKIGE